MKCLNSISVKNINVDDLYWNRYTNLIPEKVLPYQWDVLNDRVHDIPASNCLLNFKIAAGEINESRKGTVFLDSDAYKWLEAVAYSLAANPDPEMEKNADYVISLIGRAQCEDGYINTYFQLVEPQNRWKNIVEGHELYCAGHLAEAAVAYYEATGKKELLDITCRFMDLIETIFGPAPDQLHTGPGHPVIEMALVRLYNVTNNIKYLNLSKYFVDVRGESPNYFLSEMARPGFNNLIDEFKDYDPAYSQSHIPVREQTTAEGHAVRAVYLYCAMADLSHMYDDEALLHQCELLWNNIVKKRMYITGSIGSSGFLERFTTDYDLPNDSNYSETCASIGLALFGLRMARIKKDASYMDVVERALYNTVRGGIALTGDRYFYVNPLEVWPCACMPYTSKAHVKPQRQKWFDVACCPTNIARTFTSLGQYMYFTGENELYVNLFVSNTSKFNLGDEEIRVKLSTQYPKDGCVKMEISGGQAGFKLYLRVPEFAENLKVSVDGEEIKGDIRNGYFEIADVKGESTIDFCFDIIPKLVFANPEVRANTGKVALVRGPEVYCLEEVDNGNNLSSVYVDQDAEITEHWEESLFGGTMVLKLNGTRLVADNIDSSYANEPCYTKKSVELTAVPYGSWNNRKPGEMIVWMHSLI